MFAVLARSSNSHQNNSNNTNNADTNSNSNSIYVWCMNLPPQWGGRLAARARFLKNACSLPCGLQENNLVTSGLKSLPLGSGLIGDSGIEHDPLFKLRSEVQEAHPIGYTVAGR